MADKIKIRRYQNSVRASSTHVLDRGVIALVYSDGFASFMGVIFGDGVTEVQALSVNTFGSTPGFSMLTGSARDNTDLDSELDASISTGAASAVATIRNSVASSHDDLVKIKAFLDAISAEIAVVDQEITVASDMTLNRNSGLDAHITGTLLANMNIDITNSNVGDKGVISFVSPAGTEEVTFELDGDTGTDVIAIDQSDGVIALEAVAIFEVGWHHKRISDSSTKIILSTNKTL